MDNSQLLNEYASESYSMYSKVISEKDWGNKVIALEYLKKYRLPDEDYFKNWKPIQNTIFQNQEDSLPEMMFKKGFSLMAIRGGVLFEKEDYESLQRCIRQLEDDKLFIIQNDFGEKLKTSPFRMMYPSDSPWEEIMSGNFISTVIFEMFANEYFVFSESGKWGKYSANDYEKPLDIIGFKPQYESIFKEQFEQSEKEWNEIKEWLPLQYREAIK